MPLTDPIGENQKEAFTYYLSVFASERQKALLVDRFSDRTIRTLGAGVLLSSFAGPEEVAAAKIDPTLEVTRRACARAVEAGVVTDELSALISRRAFGVKLSLHRERRRLERMVLRESGYRAEALVGRSPAERLAIERRTISSAMKSRSRAATRERHAQLSQAIDQFSCSLQDLFVDELLQLRIDDDSVEPSLTAVLSDLRVVADPLMKLDPAWDSFPLKWVCADLTLPETRALVRAHARGESLTAYFARRYDSGAVSVLEGYRALGAVPLLRERREAIRQTFAAYDHGLFGPSLCAGLTIAEGMLRDFCRAIEHKHGGFENGASGYARIAVLLSSPRVRAALDGEFLEYFCSELYPARNPTMHGQRPELGSREDAAAKLATIEYMIRRLGDFMTSEVATRFEALPSSVFDELSRQFEAWSARRKEASTDSAS